MNDKNVIELKINKTASEKEHNSFESDSINRQTNPIVEKMVVCNSLTEKMKFKLKDLLK